MECFNILKDPFATPAMQEPIETNSKIKTPKISKKLKFSNIDLC